MKKQDELINNHYDYNLANFNKLAGGINQEWKDFIKNISDSLKNEQPQKEDKMEALDYNVDKKRVSR